MVKGARGALAALGVLAGALGLAAPSTAAAQAMVIELSSAAPPITHPATPGPLIEVVSLETHRRRPMAMAPAPAPATEAEPEAPADALVAYAAVAELTPQPMLDVERLTVEPAGPVSLQARFVTTSERRLEELRALEPRAVDAAIRKLERAGELQVLAEPQLLKTGAERASVSGERPVDVADGPTRMAFQAYGAELTLRPALDGPARLDLRAQVGEADHRATAAVVDGQTVVMAAPMRTAPAVLDATSAKLIPASHDRASAIQLAVIVTPQARDLVAPPRPIIQDHSPRGPPQRTALASLGRRVWRLVETPYNGALAMLSAIGKARSVA